MKNKIRILLALLILIIIFSCKLDSNNPFSLNYVTTWVNYDSIDGCPSKIHIFENNNVIIQNGHNYIISPELVSSKENKGLSLNLDQEKNQIVVKLYTINNFFLDSLVGLYKFLDNDIMLLTWSNDWSGNNIMKFIRKRSILDKEFNTIKYFYVYLIDFYKNINKNFSNYKKDRLNSLIFGYDKFVYEQLDNNKKELFLTNIRIQLYNDTLVYVDYNLNFKNKHVFETAVNVNNSIRFKDGKWKINMINILGDKYGCGMNLDYEYMSYARLLNYKPYTSNDYIRLQRIEKKRVEDSLRIAKELEYQDKLEELKRQESAKDTIK